MKNVSKASTARRK